MQFRKKPVVIDAIQWTGDNAEEVQAFLFNGHEFAADGWVKGKYVEIGTPEGLMIASIGDWIVRGVKGEHYPCKPDIFQATYEPASQPPQTPEGYRLQPISEFDAMMDTRTIPKGYKLVPIEPTVSMLQAAYNAVESEGIVTTTWLRNTIYRAMLEAAPSLDSPEVKEKP